MRKREYPRCPMLPFKAFADGGSAVQWSRVVTMIEVCSFIGKGVAPDDPVRARYDYYTLDGERIAERDAWEDAAQRKGGDDAKAD